MPADDSSPATEPAPPTPPSAWERQPSWRNPRVIGLAVGAAALLVGIIALAYVLGGSGATAQASVSPSASTAPSQAIPSPSQSGLASASLEESSTPAASTPSLTPTATSRPTAIPAAEVAALWAANATAHRAEVFVEYDCPAGGTANPVWGTENYTDDSSVCTAAVQVGLITFAQGGHVRIHERTGFDSYAGSSRHGVTSQSFGAWPFSFWFFQIDPWEATAIGFRGIPPGGIFNWSCPPSTIFYPIWGGVDGDYYTDDSSICTAAVHAGLISPAVGGPVHVTIYEGRDSYEGGLQNGVTSLDFGPFGGSFYLPSP